jgi:very-short-patch-repair endonuclease
MWIDIYNNPRLTVTRKKLRNEATIHEQLLWCKLKWSKFEWLKFRRQHSIWRYVLDFYCNSLKLWIEIDWDNHLEEKIIEYDNIREEYIKQAWIKIIRFSNYQVEKNIEQVLSKIKAYIL